MVDTTAADAVQNQRLGNLETTDKEHGARLGVIEGAQAVFSSRLNGIEKGVERIEGNTANLGSSMGDLFTEERKARALEKQADREASAAWWKQAFALAGAVLSLVTMLAGGGYVAAKNADAIPAALAAPAPRAVPAAAP